MGVLHPQQPRALNGGIPGGVQSAVRAQQRLCFAAAPTLDHQDRFIARCAAGGGDKASRIAEVLQIEQDGAGLTVAGQEVEQVIDIGIQTVAQRDKPGKAEVTLLSPVEDGIGDGGRLRDKRDTPFSDRHRREAGI